MLVVVGPIGVWERTLAEGSSVVMEVSMLVAVVRVEGAERDTESMMMAYHTITTSTHRSK